MNVELLAFQLGQKLAYIEDDRPRFSLKDLAIPLTAGAGAVGGALLGGNRDNISKFIHGDRDLRRMADAIRGIAGRIDGVMSRHPAATGAIGGAAAGAAGAATLFGLGKLVNVLRERDQMRGQLSAQQSFPMGMGQFQG